MSVVPLSAFAAIRHPGDVVKRLNPEYAVVLVGGSIAVLHERTDPYGRPELRFLGVDAFREWLRPYKVDAGGRSIPIANVWLNDERRRQYDGVVFAPGEDPGPRYYNLWKGFAVQPDARASCQLFLDHIAENVCRTDEQLFAWVMGWFAHLIQRPAERIGTALVLRGPQGVGKTIVGEMIGRLLGPHYQLVSEPRYITGRFNSHLAACLLLQLDEGVWGGDHVAAGRLKDLITGSEHLIEYKGKEPVRVKNYVRLLITSNNEWVVPAGLEERRFAVLDVGEEHQQDTWYFRRVREQMLEQGGLGALLHYLQTYDITDIPLREIPVTSALHEQIVRSLPDDLAWWIDLLMAGQLPGDTAGDGITPCKALYDHYLAHAQVRGVTRRSSETALGIFLKRYVPDLPPRHRLTRQTPGGMKRVWCYTFPPLKACRQRIDALTKRQWDWSDPDAEWSACP
jgi:hypothetical protein